MLPELAHPGSLVFAAPSVPVPLHMVSWWEFRLGADWRRPLGPESSLDGLDDHPVVHVAWQDAAAYATWAGKALPTEAEWEYAAWGGVSDCDYAWGNELAPGGQMLANYWQGPFPHANSLADGWERTSPVASYPPNGFGLYDMIGNVWEWTTDWYGLPDKSGKPRSQCCVPRNPRGGNRKSSLDPGDPSPIPRRVLKGGSHLCAESYCQRYRPAARHPQAIDSSTSHIGFRCIRRGK
jgi:formylglycine-generating enzyme required for sulfatase activity